MRLCVCAMPENAGNCGVLRQNFAQQRLCEIRFRCVTWSRLKKHLAIPARYQNRRCRVRRTYSACGVSPTMLQPMVQLRPTSLAVPYTSTIVGINSSFPRQKGIPPSRRGRAAATAGSISAPSSTGVAQWPQNCTGSQGSGSASSCLASGSASALLAPVPSSSRRASRSMPEA